MTLGFKQTFPWGEPTHFREKILIGPMDSGTRLDMGLLMPSYAHVHPKLHTFREDKHDRWKAGRKIEMVYRGAGYSIIDHFNKGIPELEKCVSVQKIKLWYTGWTNRETGDSGMDFHCTIDGKRFEDIRILARNDGFSDVTSFHQWFNKPLWQGKIIHWTDLRY